MSNLIGRLLGATVAETATKIGGMVRSFVTTDKDRAELQLKLEAVLQQDRDSIEKTIRKELEAKERILVAELTQGDSYTKRARPTILYSGVVFTFLNYVFFPVLTHFTGNSMPPLELPEQFWWTWGGISSTYVVGRSAEKRGVRNKVTSFITGS